MNISKLTSYFLLARIHKPTGIFLLYIPCLAGLAWGEHIFSSWTLLYFLGATLLRGAGCTLNDYFDRDFDKNVARTKNRPLASHSISSQHALVFFALQSFASLGIFYALSTLGKIMSLFFFFIACLYPLAKRYTYFPQAILGLAFNSGFLISIAQFRPLYTMDFLYYAGFIFFTMAYDSIYAASDRLDDEKIGVKSIPVKFKHTLPHVVQGFYGVCGLFFILALYLKIPSFGGFIISALITLSVLIDAFLRVSKKNWDMNNSSQNMHLFKKHVAYSSLLVGAIIIGHFF
jgi:4-hydroxybenzoate polyprenyltransferase